MQRKSLYQQAIETIRAMYIDGRPAGYKLPSERKLEDLFSISSSTVRNALKRLETDGYIERRHGSGSFVLERGLPNRHVGLLMEVDISSRQISPYYLQKLQELRLILLKMGVPSRPYLGYLRLGVEIGELTCKELLDDIRFNRISGVISVLAAKDLSWMSELKKRGIPLVGTNYACETVVNVDARKAAHEILHYLKERGRRDLAVVSIESQSDRRKRLQEEMLALSSDYGMTARAFSVPIYAEAWRQEPQWQTFRSLWASQPPGALLLCDDMLLEPFHEVIRSSEARGVEMVLYGSDAVELPPDLPMARCLRSVRLEARKLAETMQQRLEGKEVPSFIEIPTSLIPQNSTEKSSGLSSTSHH